MKIQITFELDEDDEYADPGHEMGVTEAGYEYIVDRLFGDDFHVVRVD